MTTPKLSGQSDDSSDLFDRRFIASHLSGKIIADRAWLNTAIEDQLNDPECRIVLVTGDPGAGKTVQLASLANMYPQWLRYFIRRAGKSESPHRHEGGLASFLITIGMQLADLHPELFPGLEESMRVYNNQMTGDVFGSLVGTDIYECLIHPFYRLEAHNIQHVGSVHGEVVGTKIRRVIDLATQKPADLAEPALFGPARKLAEKSPKDRIVVLLDGLDELHFRDVGAGSTKLVQWLAGLSELPSNLRFVIGCRHKASELDVLRHCHKYFVREVIIKNDSKNVYNDTIDALGKLVAIKNVRQLLTSRSIAPERFIREVSRSMAGNFQYLSFLERSLEVATPADSSGQDSLTLETGASDLTWLDNIQNLPTGLDQLYSDFLVRIKARITQERWAQLYRPVLGMLSVSRRPLTPSQLNSFGRWSNTFGEVAGEVLEAVRQFLDGDDEIGYRFHHTSVNDFLTARSTKKSQDADFHCNPKKAHAAIVKYALQAHGKDGSWKNADPYVRAFVAAHAAAVRKLDSLIEDPLFLIAADPPGILDVLAAVGRAAPVARIYRQVLSSLRGGDEGAALAHLELYARQADLSAFADRVAAAGGTRPWELSWTQRRPTALRQELGRHHGEVNALAITHLDRNPLAVTGGSDGALCIWDLRQGEMVRYTMHGDDPKRPTSVTALATGELPSGEPFVVFGGKDGVIRKANLADGLEIGTLNIWQESAGKAIAIGNLIGIPHALCDNYTSARVWNMDTGRAVSPPIIVKDPENAAFSEYHGRSIVAIGENIGPGEGQIRVFDVLTGDAVGKPLLCSEAWVEAVDITAWDDTVVVAVCDGGGSVQVWDLLTGEALSPRFVDGENKPSAVALGTVLGRKVMAVGYSSGLIRFWDVALKQQIKIAGKKLPFIRISSLAIQDDVELLIIAGEHEVEGSSSRNSVIQVMTCEPNKRSDKIRLVARHIVQSQDEARSLVVSATRDSPTLFGRIGSRVYIWDIKSGHALGQMYGDREKVSALAVSKANRKPTVVSCVGKRVSVWDLVSGRETRPSLELPSDLQYVVSIGVSTRRGHPVAVCGTWSTGVVLWDMVTGDFLGPEFIGYTGYIHSMTVASLNGRAVVIVGGDSVEVYDLESGDLIADARSLGYRGQFVVVAAAVHNGRSLVISGAADRSIRAWNISEVPKQGGDSSALAVIDNTDVVQVLDVTQLDGRLVIVASGRSGAVRVIDAEGEATGQGLGSASSSIVLADHSGTQVAVCGGEDGTQVVDIETGLLAAPLPSLGKTVRDVRAVASAVVAGRSIGICSTYSSIYAWYLDTGEKTAMRPIEHAQARSVGVGLFHGRLVVVSGGDDSTVRVSDLDTGQLVCEPLNQRGSITGIGIVELDGRDLLVYARPNDVRARYLTSFEEDQRYAAALDASMKQWAESGVTGPTSPMNETPLPTPRIGERLTGRGGRVMALGSASGVPFVISGGDQGQIWMYAIDSALPIGKPLLGHEGPVTALAFGVLHGGPVIASGGTDQTVRFWDPSNGKSLLVMNVRSWAQAITLAAPDRAIIGTEMGMIAIRLGFARSAVANSNTLRRRRIVLPTDQRSVRSCLVHDEPLQIRDGVLRVCIKGIQMGNPSVHQLEYSQGHCYVLVDGRMVITESSSPEWSMEGLVLQAKAMYLEATDTPHAYQYDGCHFGIVLDGAGAYRTLCCYTRTDRNELFEALKRC